MRRVGGGGKVTGRAKAKKVRDYKTLTELAAECGLTRQGLNIRLYARGIPYEKIGSGKQPTIVVRKRYWQALKRKTPTWF